MIHFRRKRAEPFRRVYVVGDVHGRFDLFRRLMTLIARDQATRGPAATQIVLLGDIVDRGPDAAPMVRGCMNLTGVTDRFMVLRGNHEEMMAEALRGNLTVYGHWLNFGGRETLRSWGVDQAVVDGPATAENLQVAADTVGGDVLEWLAGLPLCHRHGDYLFVHAGIRPGVPIRRQRSDDLLWIGEDFLESEESHGVTVVHGHSIVEDGPVIRPNRIGIDTGAYRTGRLTALGIEEGEMWTLNTTPQDAGSADPDDDADLLLVGPEDEIRIGNE